MSIDELCALPVETLAEKDCLLFLWATFPQLPEALRLIKAWGFSFKTVAFVWLKLNRKSPTWFYGLGYWTRGNAEICLLAKRGHPKRYSKSVHQFIISPVEEHSKKPDITREKIIALAATCPAQNCLPDRKPPAGMCGAMKWTAIFPCPYQKRGDFYGLCNCPQGFNQGQIQGSIRADETPAHLFWRCAACRRPAFLFDPGPRPDQRGGAHYGVRHAAGLSAGALRKTRPAP